MVQGVRYPLSLVEPPGGPLAQQRMILK